MFAVIGEIFGGLAHYIGMAYEPGKVLNGFVVSFLSIFTIHQTLYFLVGLFFTRKFTPAKEQHKYAILIPARNEEPVIGNLLDSIKRQDYPSELITVFVVADNCTDNTAAVAREKGAICYERFNDEERTKGFALKFLFENIEKDYGIETFEGYFIFDSDNLLNRDYVTKMNDAFDAGEKIITSYRNSKNFDENWVASTYALHWIRSVRFRHRARSVFRLATNIQGTGFLFANELVKDGWKYTSLTEDRAFTADAVAHGYKISYQDEAMFYDEQPTSFRISIRQRIRWSKGHILAFLDTGWPLFKNIFVGNCYKEKTEKGKLTKADVVEGIRHRWASFDTLAQLVPSVIIKLFMWILVYIVFFSAYCYDYGIQDTLLFKGGSWLATGLNKMFGGVCVNLPAGGKALVASIGLVILWRIISKLSYDIENMLTAVYVFLIERKRIKKIKLWKKMLYCITFPTFDILYRYSMYAALFMKVTWKPIPHTSKITIEDVEQ